MLDMYNANAYQVEMRERSIIFGVFAHRKIHNFRFIPICVIDLLIDFDNEAMMMIEIMYVPGTHAIASSDNPIMITRITWLNIRQNIRY